MEKLHPGARWMFRIRAYFILIFLTFFFSIWSLPLLGLFFKDNLFGLLVSLFLPLLVGIIFIIVVGEIYAQMAYNRWFYELTPTNLKIERGIIWKRYSNVPYERVQNVDITRGILARILGFSTVNIQTAGYSYAGRGMAVEGYLPAVSVKRVEEIRTFVMKKIGKRQGL